MKRRTAILGLGGLVAGGSAAMGTSAFTNVEAERQTSVTVRDDSESYLSLTPADDDGEPITQPGVGNRSPEAQSEPYAIINEETGRLELNLTALNDNAEFTFENLFVIQNLGSQDVEVTIEQVGPEAGALTFFTEVDGDEEIIGSDEGVELQDGGSATIGIEATTFDADPDEPVIDEIVVEADARGDSS